MWKMLLHLHVNQNTMMMMTLDHTSRPECMSHTKTYSLKQWPWAAHYYIPISQELVTNFFHEKVGACICKHRQGL